jgi:hypothetical protein
LEEDDWDAAAAAAAADAAANANCCCFLRIFFLVSSLSGDMKTFLEWEWNLGMKNGSLRVATL